MESEKTALLFGVHMHQPVDNFDEAVERAVESCYAPFFATMAKYPEFRFSLHCSGWLLKKIEREYGDLFDDMHRLAKAGSVEFLTAGFYEPVLGSIPASDRIAQIRRLSETIHETFAQKPTGLWLTERVWEAGLVPDMAQAGVKYALVDDYHFIAAGFDAGSLRGFFFSEESGRKVALFPISQALRYAIPFKPVPAALEAIRASAQQKGDAAIIFDDLEKFGMWPGTHEWVHEKGWLKAFVETVLEEEAIVPVQYGEFVSKNRAKGIAYLPNVSYYEMGEWSLFADDALRLQRVREKLTGEGLGSEAEKFLKGGIWKNFFVKYEESNRLHKRMLECADNRLETPEYRDALHRLQTNDVFWHGVFGGLYLPNLRDNAYRYLTECENLRYGKKRSLECADIDMNGYEEIKWVGSEVIMRFDSRFGGQLVELCDRRHLFNFQNVLTRRKEAYHEKLLQDSGEQQTDAVKEEGISTIHTARHRAGEEIRKALVYDWYVKNSFIDHISDHTLNSESFRDCSFREFSDFANQPFDMVPDASGVTFSRTGGIYDPDRYKTVLTKRYDFLDDGLSFSVELESESSHIYEYGIEFNLHFADLSKVSLNAKAFESGTFHELRSFTLDDPYTGRRVEFSLDHFFSLIAVPLQTVSQSEEGFELMTQGVSLIAVLPFSKKLEAAGFMKVYDV